MGGVIPFRHDHAQAQKAGITAGQIGFDADGSWSIAKNHRLLMGQASGAITSVRPAKQIIERMMEDALRVLKGHISLVKPLREEVPMPDSDSAHRRRPSLPPKEWTAAEVAEHSNSRDCWVVVNGKVLDLSKFAHP